jgi:DNA (cytosine-5)-methyltransferase 1
MTGLTGVSLFAGIEGFGLALERAGVDVVASVEIDPDCRAVIARHFPETKLFDDVRTVTGNDLRAAGFVPGRGVLCAGWPCQGNSVAGRRGGMGDPRSGLWRHVVRLVAETRPAWFIGENVPGLLSVNGGADIAVVRNDLAQLGYWWAERVLDSQHFGVAQRRQRVFFVGCPGDRSAPVEVLLEPEGGDGDPATGRQARTGATVGAPGRTAATLQGGGRRGHRIDAEGAAGGHLILSQNGSDIQTGSQLGALTAGMARQTSGDLIAFDTVQITHAENRSNPQPGDPSPTLNGNGLVHVARSPLPFRVGETSAAITAHHGKGPDSDATNGLIIDVPHGTLTLPARDRVRDRREGKGADSDATSGLIVTPALAAMPDVRVAASAGVNPPGRRQEDDFNLVAHALTSEGADASEDGTGRAYGTSGVPRPVPSSLAVAGDFSTGEDIAQTVRSAHGQPGCVTAGLAVRRLTPRECERLQAFPDDWTRWKLVKGELVEQSDSARYRQIGNAVTTTVVEWIARRVVAYEASREQPDEAGAA